MSGELWRSEVPIWAFIFLNCIAVATAFIYAYRKGHFSDLDETMRKTLLNDDAPAKENFHG